MHGFAVTRLRFACLVATLIVSETLSNLFNLWVSSPLGGSWRAYVALGTGLRGFSVEFPYRHEAKRGVV